MQILLIVLSFKKLYNSVKCKILLFHMIGWLSVTYNDKPPMLKANRCSRSCQSVLLSPSAGGCEEAVYLPLRPHTCPASPSLVTHIYVVITVQCILHVEPRTDPSAEHAIYLGN